MSDEKIEAIKESLKAFYSTLHPYDFYSFYWLGGIAFVSLILIILLRNNHTITGLLTIIFLSTFTIAPIVNYYFIHQYLYGTTYKLDYLKQMKFADVLFIKGTLTSIGKEEITRCYLHTFVMPQRGILKTLQPLWALKLFNEKNSKLNKELKIKNLLNFNLNLPILNIVKI